MKYYAKIPHVYTACVAALDVVVGAWKHVLYERVESRIVDA